MAPERTATGRAGRWCDRPDSEAGDADRCAADMVVLASVRLFTVLLALSLLITACGRGRGPDVEATVQARLAEEAQKETAIARSVQQTVAAQMPTTTAPLPLTATAESPSEPPAPPTLSATQGVTVSPTESPIPRPPTNTPTAAPAPTETPAPRPPTNTPTAVPTPTQSPVPRPPTSTPTVPPSPTNTPTAVPSPTNTPTYTIRPMPTATRTIPPPGPTVYPTLTGLPVLPTFPPIILPPTLPFPVLQSPARETGSTTPPCQHTALVTALPRQPSQSPWLLGTSEARLILDCFRDVSNGIRN
jgi:hypothetical protein